MTVMTADRPAADEDRLRCGDVLPACRTDLAEIIVDCNQAFLDATGHGRDDVVGRSLEIIRHPDTPDAVLAELRATIAQGLPWEGLLKYRSGRGGGLWARATVTPTITTGTTTGHVWIWSEPSPEETAEAVGFYAGLRAGEAAHLTLRHGAIVRRGWLARLAVAADSVGARVAAAVLVMVLAAIADWWIGQSGMAESNRTMEALHAHRLRPALELHELRRASNVCAWEAADAVLAMRAGRSAGSHVAAIERARADADLAWERYRATGPDAEERALVDRLDGAYREFAADGVGPTLELLRVGDMAGAEDHLTRHLMPALARVANLTGSLVAMLDRLVEDDLAAAAGSYRMRWWAALVTTALAVLLALLLGGLALVAFRRPLRIVEANVLRIAGGDLTGAMAQPRAPEFRQVSRSLRAMRARLRHEIDSRTEADQRSAAARRQTLHDPLTGLYNRRFLEEVWPSLAGQIRRRGGPLAVAMVDIDHFKRLNDEHGHAVGDRVLVELARIMQATVRQSDVVIRYGGEEFVVLLPNCGLENARRRMEELRERVATVPTRLGDRIPPFTVSIGVVGLPACAADLADAIVRADAALYRAKGAGRNRVAAGPAADPGAGGGQSAA